MLVLVYEQVVQLGHLIRKSAEKYAGLRERGDAAWFVTREAVSPFELLVHGWLPYASRLTGRRDVTYHKRHTVDVESAFGKQTCLFRGEPSHRAMVVGPLLLMGDGKDKTFGLLRGAQWP